MPSYQRVRTRHLEDFRSEIPGWWSHLRTTNVASGALVSDTRASGPYIPGGNLPQGVQVTSDTNHGGPFKRRHRVDVFEGDIGGDFLMKRSGISYQGGQSHVHSDVVSAGFRNVSDIEAPLMWSFGPTVVLPGDLSSSNLAASGTTAIARCKPTNNVANLAVDLVEIRKDGLPHLTGAHLWKDRTHLARAAGSEYLNHEFGWLPLASDIRNASYAAANAHKLLQNYERNSGKMVRRHYEYPVEHSVSVSTASSNVGTFLNGPSIVPSEIQSQLPRGIVIRTETKFVRRWFSGGFTYHLPPGWGSRFGLVDAAAKAGPLLGIELTPEVVWNAAPWTWALDWFSNVGDVISNASDMQVDGLVLKYGYIMEHTFHEYKYDFLPSGVPVTDSGTSLVLPLITSWFETKKRERATPFGFGISWNGLSFRQLAIAAALGITRWL